MRSISAVSSSFLPVCDCRMKLTELYSRILVSFTTLCAVRVRELHPSHSFRTWQPHLSRPMQQHRNDQTFLRASSPQWPQKFPTCAGVGSKRCPASWSLRSRWWSWNEEGHSRSHFCPFGGIPEIQTTNPNHQVTSSWTLKWEQNHTSNL